MARKAPTRAHASTDPASLAATLADDEEIVVEDTNTKRIRRERQKPVEEKAIEAEPVLDDEDADDPPYSDTSLAAMLFNETERERLDNSFCTITVRREPDSMNDSFLTRCGSRTWLPRLTNIPLTTDHIDIEEKVRQLYGGGHYLFQIRYDGRIAKSWPVTLSDDPAAVARARAEAAGVVTHAPAPAAAASSDPVTAFLDGLIKQRQLKEALFGDEQARFEREIADLKAEVARKDPAEPKSEKLALLEIAMDSKNADARDRLLNHLFPAEEKGGRHWIADTIEVVLENKDAILGVIGTLLGGLAPPAQQRQPSIDDMMRAAPPTGAAMPAGLAPPSSQFRRRTLADAGPIDAEPVPETDDVGDGPFPEIDLSDIVEAQDAPVDAGEFEAVESFTPPQGDDDFAPVSEIVVPDGDAKPRKKRVRRPAK